MQAFIPVNDARGFIMPNFIFENHKLNCGAKVLFSTLCDYARDKSYCYPSKQTLADRLNVSINTIKTWLNQLISFGYVQIKQTGKRLFFHLFRPKKIESKTATQPSKFDDELSKIDTEVNVKNLNNLKIIPPVSPKEHNEIPNQNARECEIFSFEDFWAKYPRKENKEKARKSFLKILKIKKLPSLNIFQKAVEFFMNCQQWQKENGRFIPQLHNFLNDLRWEDIPKESLLSQPKNEVLAVKNFSYKELEERNRKIKEEREKERLAKEKCEKEEEIITRCWNNFISYFKGDSKTNLIFARRYYAILFRKGLIPQVIEEQKCTVFDFLEPIYNKQT